MNAVLDLFAALPGRITDAATSPFGATALAVLAVAALTIAANVIITPRRERAADRRVRRDHR